MFLLYKTIHLHWLFCDQMLVSKVDLSSPQQCFINLKVMTKISLKSPNILAPFARKFVALSTSRWQNKIKFSQKWRDEEREKELKLWLQILPFRMIEVLEVDDEGSQEVEDREVCQEVSNNFLVRCLSAPLEFVDGVELSLNLFEEFAGWLFALEQNEKHSHSFPAARCCLQAQKL